MATQSYIPGPISAEDWSRFAYYAQFVRVLTCDYDSTFDPSVFTYLHQHTHGKPLFPNLRHLIWHPATTDLISVLSPTIRVLRLPADVEGSDNRGELDELAYRLRRHALKTLLRSILQSLPELRVLELRHERLDLLRLLADLVEKELAFPVQCCQGTATRK